MIIAELSGFGAGERREDPIHPCELPRLFLGLRVDINPFGLLPEW